MSEKGYEAVVRMYSIKQNAIYDQLQRGLSEHPSFHFPIVVASVFNHACMAAAWVTFTHQSIEKYSHGGVWQDGTFRYDLYLLGTLSTEPVLVWTDRIQKQHPEGKSACMRRIATEIDGISIDKERIYVRDRRFVSGTAAAYPDNWSVHIRPPTPI